MKSFNTHLMNRLSGIQAALMAQKVGGFRLPNAVVGSERETFLRDFLSQVFPAHRRFSSGAITDSEGRISGQVDIAIEYGEIPSFPMPGTSERLLLAESVAAVIEVKSDLVAQWGQVTESTKKVKALRRNLNSIMTIGRAPGPVIPVVAVGYSGHKTMDALEKRLLETPEDERPTAALVIESGAFAGYDMAAYGTPGLYCLCVLINQELARVGMSRPDLFAYMRPDERK